MRKFTIKLLFTSLLILIPSGYYHYFVENNESGDIGKLGMIPFGDEYDGLDVDWYNRDSMIDATVVDVYDKDSLKKFPIITIGDSFSQFKNNGYQYKLSSKAGVPVANFKTPYYLESPNCIIALINGGVFKEGQTVIVESVERSLIWRFSKVDTLIKFKNEATEVNDFKENENNEPFLNRYLSWIRLKLNYKNPITRYSLTKDCFSHPRFSNTLHVYNNIKGGDGDLLWQNLSEDEFERAGRNMEKIIDIAARNGINILILIATDKYDAYEPWIATSHQENPTLCKIPKDPRIFDSRPLLRSAIERGIKDVYKLNDTHWSVVGADIIGGSVYETMINLGYLPTHNVQNNPFN